LEEKPHIFEDRIEHLSFLEDILSYKFTTISLLHQALTHRSFVNENQDLNYSDNERLEFLGDAVLELCITDILVRRFPRYTEGQLSKLRASIVNEQPLARVAELFDVGKFLLLGKGEEASGGRHKSSLLSNTFEALIAAVYLDGGFEKAYDFVENVFTSFIDEWTEDRFYRDYKTSLQELSQSRYKVIPRYTLLHEYGPDHDKIFQVKLTVADRISATGIGRSKKEAEQNAAKKALDELSDEVENGPQ
jgi:ribonuclease-3